MHSDDVNGKSRDENGSTGPRPVDTADLERLLGKLGGDLARYLPAAVVPALTAVASVAVFTRIFGAEAYGEYALVAASCTVVASVIAGWLQQGTLRYLPRYLARGALADFLAQLLMLLLVSAAAWLVLTLIGFPMSDGLGAYRKFYFPAALLVAGEMTFLALNTVFQSQLRSTAYGVFRIVGALLRLALALGFVFFIRRSVVGLVAGAAAADLILCVPMLRAIRPPPLRRILSSFDRPFLRMFAAYGAPMIGWMLVGQVLNLSDRFVIGAFRGSAEVGIYSANYALVATALGLLSAPILMAAQPIIMQAWEKGVRGDITVVISAFSRHYLMIIVPFVAVVALLSEDIAGLLLGAEFREGHGIIPWVVAGAAVWGFSMYGHKPLELLEKTRVMLALAAICAAANLGLNLLLVPRWGYYAAAVTTFASYLLYPALVSMTLRKSYPWRIPKRAFLTVAAATAVLAAVTLGIRSLLADETASIIMMTAAGTAGFAAYAGCLLVLGELRDEMRILRRRRSVR